jgi:hypothetical protein
MTVAPRVNEKYSSTHKKDGNARLPLTLNTRTLSSHLCKLEARIHANVQSMGHMSFYPSSVPSYGSAVFLPCCSYG